MREIKFRGKTEQGMWVYGYYHRVQNDDTAYCDYIATETTGHIRVQAETVGQYTGMKDRNGIEIYEGDIVIGRNYKGEAGKHRLVEWSYSGYHGNDLSIFAINRCEVIGNIYDNRKQEVGLSEDMDADAAARREFDRTGFWEPEEE